MSKVVYDDSIFLLGVELHVIPFFFRFLMCVAAAPEQVQFLQQAKMCKWRTAPYTAVGAADLHLCLRSAV